MEDAAAELNLGLERAAAASDCEDEERVVSSNKLGKLLSW
jgi:hypothetical protein